MKFVFLFATLLIANVSFADASHFEASQPLYVAMQAIGECQSSYPRLMSDKVIWADASVDSKNGMRDADGSK